jgi:hypothetical protein
VKAIPWRSTITQAPRGFLYVTVGAPLGFLWFTVLVTVLSVSDQTVRIDPSSPRKIDATSGAGDVTVEMRAEHRHRRVSLP